MLVPMSLRSPSSSSSPGLWEMWETRSRRRSVFQAAVGIAKRFPRGLWETCGKVAESSRPAFQAQRQVFHRPRQPRHFPQAARARLSPVGKILFRRPNRPRTWTVEQVTNLFPGRPTTLEALELALKIGPPDPSRQCRRVSEAKSLHYKVGRRGLLGSGNPVRRTGTSSCSPGPSPDKEEHTQREEDAHGDSRWNRRQ